MYFARGTGPELVAALVLTAVLSVASTAGAASPADRAAARQHLRQAEEAKEQGRIAEACGHLQEVERLDPKLPSLIAVAECSEQAGDWVAAEEQWARARDRAKRDEKPQSRAKAEARLAVAQKRVARLTLQLAASAAGAQVLRDGVALDAASLGSALPTNPGEHVIVVKLAGHDDAKYSLKLGDGESQALTLAAGPAVMAASTATAPTAPTATPPAPALPAQATPPPPSPPPGPPKVDAAPSLGWWSTEHKAGLLFGGVGLAAVGGGTALCLVAAGDKKESGLVDRRLAAGGLSIAAGGVLLVSSLVLLATTSDSSQRARTPLTPTLLVAHHAAVIGALGEF